MMHVFLKRGFRIFSRSLAASLFLLLGFDAAAQPAYFIDGYHGGVWGHYPSDYTAYIVSQLEQHPDWNINLEIEPETWDKVRRREPDAYRRLRELVLEKRDAARIDFVNPSYAQSYLFTIGGESIIRQFWYGMNKVWEHFPGVPLSVYSSEEPCFTSALPQLLTLFGFRYASLKNPNTAWGGYMKATGGEALRWRGPDGSSLLTVPRYASEELLEGSTWETTANANSERYIQRALEQGIKHPIGMCLQDAEWRIGPWLQGEHYQPTRYTTWTNYFKCVIDSAHAPEYRLHQEDLHVSLVWGSQVLQKIAQQVRRAENSLLQAEQLAALSKAFQPAQIWPQRTIDSAWRTLMLAQHHDCWIVPLNGAAGDTWADRVESWTNTTQQKSREILQGFLDGAIRGQAREVPDLLLKVWNTSGQPRKEWVQVKLPQAWAEPGLKLIGATQKDVPSFLRQGESGKELWALVEVPAAGFASFTLEPGGSPIGSENMAYRDRQGLLHLETDLYRLILDPQKGGTVRHLFDKSSGKELTGEKDGAHFNEIKGYFYKEKRFHSSADHPASIEVVEQSGPLLRARIKGKIGQSAFQQEITLMQGEPRIDFSVQIDWEGEPGIGAWEEKDFDSRSREKAFYNDSLKLQLLFPVNFEASQLHKDAPFDVVESQLENTFFNRWDSIKNAMIYQWVDISDTLSGQGLTLFSDHLTTYGKAPGRPLGLTLAYSGKGLWGRDYELQGRSKVRYAILPHSGDWQSSDLSGRAQAWNQPLIAAALVRDYEQAGPKSESLFELSDPALQVSAMGYSGGKFMLRLFDPVKREIRSSLRFNRKLKEATRINLLGEKLAEVERSGGPEATEVSLQLRPFELQTLLLDW